MDLRGHRALRRRAEVAGRLEVDTAILLLGGVRFPVTGPVRYTMTARDAVELCGLVGPHTAIPSTTRLEALQGGPGRHRARAREAPEDISRRFRWLPKENGELVGTSLLVERLAVQAQELRSARPGDPRTQAGLTAADIDAELERPSSSAGSFTGTLHLVPQRGLPLAARAHRARPARRKRRRLLQKGVTLDEAERAVTVVERALAGRGPAHQGRNG